MPSSLFIIVLFNYSRNLKTLILGVQFVLNGTELGILLKTMVFGVYGMGLWNDVLFHYSS